MPTTVFPGDKSCYQCYETGKTGDVWQNDAHNGVKRNRCEVS